MLIVGVGAVAGVLIYAFLEMIIGLMLHAVVWISGAVMGTDMTHFGVTDNIFSVIERSIDLGPLAGQVDLMATAKAIGFAVIALQLVIGIMKSMMAPMTGENTENPWQVLARCLTAGFLIVFFFGVSIGENYRAPGAIELFGKAMSSALSYLSGPYDTAFASAQGIGGAFVSGPKTHIAIIILLGGMLAGVIGAAITYIERLLSFYFYMLLGPLFLSLYSGRNTQEAAKQWILGIFVQALVIFLSLFMWILFLNNLASLKDILTVGETSTEFIFRAGLCMGILALVQNSERLLNGAGIRTIPNGDTARMAAAGIGAFSAGVGTALSGSKFLNSSSAGKAANAKVWDTIGKLPSPSAAVKDLFASRSQKAAAGSAGTYASSVRASSAAASGRKTLADTGWYQAVDAQKAPSQRSSSTAGTGLLSNMPFRTAASGSAQTMYPNTGASGAYPAGTAVRADTDGSLRIMPGIGATASQAANIARGNDVFSAITGIGRGTVSSADAFDTVNNAIGGGLTTMGYAASGSGSAAAVGMADGTAGVMFKAHDTKNGEDAVLVYAPSGEKELSDPARTSVMAGYDNGTSGMALILSVNEDYDADRRSLLDREPTVSFDINDPKYQTDISYTASFRTPKEAFRIPEDDDPGKHRNGGRSG